MTGPGPNEPDARKYENPETALGGADAVEKTSYVTGRGAEPSGRSEGRPAASVRAGGFGMLGWVVVVIVLLAVIAYAIPLFR